MITRHDVVLTKHTADGKRRVERWKYWARDVALVRVGVVLQQHPEADLDELPKRTDAETGATVVEFALAVDERF